MLFKQMVAAKEEVDHPWQADIDRLQQSLQEVLQVVSHLSGVELPGSTADSEASGDSSILLDCKTLKDRIHADLESFAEATAIEMTGRAERQARVALAAIHNEVDGQVERIARDLREKLQEQLEPEHIEIGITQQTRDRVAELVERRTEEFARWTWLMCKGTGAPIPVQIQHLLEPYVDEASARVKESFRREFQEELAGQEQSARERLQSVLNSLEGNVRSFEEASQEVFERTAGSICRTSEERLTAARDEAVQNFEDRIGHQMEDAFEAFQVRLEQAAQESRQTLRQQEEEMAGKLGRWMEELDSEIEGKIKGAVPGHIERISAGVIETTAQQLRRQAEDAAEHAKNELCEFIELQVENGRVRINELGQSVQHSLIQEAERREDGLRKQEEEMTGIRGRNLGDFQDQLTEMISASLGSARDRASQASEAQVAEAERLLREVREREASQLGTQLRNITDTWHANLVERIQTEAGKVGSRVAAEVRESSGSILQELSGKVDTSAVVLREQEDRAVARMDALLKKSLASYQQHLIQISETQLGEHRRAIRKSLDDLRCRLERSARALQQSFAAGSEPDLSHLSHPAGNTGTQPVETTD